MSQNVFMLEEIRKAIVEVETGNCRTSGRRGGLTGFSGDKLICALQRLASLYEGDDTACYLEIGVYQGLTLLSVASACPRLQCYGVDNFAFFDPNGENLDIIRTRKEQLGAENAIIVNKDYEDALQELPREIGEHRVAVFFVDGPHDYRSQLMCLQLALPFLGTHAVIVVDDANYAHVRQANRDFLVTHPEFKLLFEAYTPAHPANLEGEANTEAREGWWNGVNILVCDPENRLAEMLPPTIRSRHLYENEHLVHAAPMAEWAPQAVEILHAAADHQWHKALMRFVRHYPSMREHTKKNKDRYLSMNTYSERLTRGRFNTVKAQP